MLARLLLFGVLVSLLLNCTGCGENRPSSTVTSTVPGSVATNDTQRANTVILQMLTNIQKNGYNADSQINGGMGGLWINWRYGSTPLQTNFQSSGKMDGPSYNPPRHDVLTDLRYLHALWAYKSLHEADTQFDSELSRYTAIVKREFTHPQNIRGWLYDLFIDLYQLSHDTFYRQAAYDLVDYYYQQRYHANVGLIYDVAAGHQRGYYRVDLALESSCALIQAGTLFNKPEWVDAGKKVLKQLYATAYLPKYHTFVFVVDNVLMPDGTVNPDPGIFRDMIKTTKVEGGNVRMGSTAQEVLSLLHTYSVTHDKAFLDDATDLLDPVTAENNSLGMWDIKNLGYYSAAVFPGPSVKNAGIPIISRGNKESGRQLQMLEAFRVADVLTNNHYQAMQDVLFQLAIHQAYYDPGHGVLYQETNDWQPIRLHKGGIQDWVTTEAMGIALEGLFSIQRSNPW